MNEAKTANEQPQTYERMHEARKLSARLYRAVIVTISVGTGLNTISK
jgi:hypothetical protein